MMLRKVWLAALALAACDDPPGTSTTLPGLMDSSVVATPDAGDAGTALRSGPAYAVISSDYTITAISLLDAEGNVVADNYINSGTTRAGLVTTLSGDVVMPRASGESGVLVILDRFRSDVLTRIRLADGVVLGQVKTNTPPDQSTTSSYSSNPQDYIYLNAQTAYVTRGEPNVAANAAPLDLGDDMLGIDPSTMQRTSERISFSALDRGTLYARPGRMVRLGRTVVVGINVSSFDYQTLGDGVIALVDLDSKAVTSLPIPDLQNCADVAAVPNATDTVLVSCAGNLRTNSKDEAGFALVKVAGGSAQITNVWRARDDASAVPFNSGSVALGGTLVGAAADDFSGKSADVYAVLDLANGSKTMITSVTPGNGAFGTPAFDAASGVLLVPDASTDKNERPTAGVRRFKRNADGSFSELAIVKVAESTALPARHVFAL